jgi:hypothetical protein
VPLIAFLGEMGTKSSHLCRKGPLKMGWVHACTQISQTFRVHLQTSMELVKKKNIYVIVDNWMYKSQRGYGLRYWLQCCIIRVAGFILNAQKAHKQPECNRN